jgi:regulator of protease activity HflC (stomatin/prohibitin superfamily)
MSCVTKLIVFVVVVGLLLMVILLPLSLQRLGVNEVGIKYDKVTRSLGSKILREGLHDVGPSGTLLTFETSQRDATFTKLVVLSSDALRINVTVVVTYSLNTSHIFQILEDFGSQSVHDDFIEDISRTAIYDTAAATSANDFYTRRQQFQAEVQANVQKAFRTKNVYADIYFVQVVNIDLPTGIVAALTETTVAQQDIINAVSERGAAVQQAQINLDLATSQANITILKAELSSAVIQQQAIQSVIATRTKLTRRSDSFVNISTALGNGGDFFVHAYLKPLVLSRGDVKTVINV